VQLLIRTLLIWLLVLAVPAQSAAASTMAFCGPGHHPASGRGQSSPVNEQAHHQNGAAHGHMGSAVHSQEHGSALSASAAAPSKAVAADKHKCSACASCCSAAAILDAVLSVPPPGVSLTVFADVVPTVDAFATDGPDRPPRLVLA
jgi:hypothetical protein